MKVAIVGSAPSSRDLAPYHDPGWEIWGLNNTPLKRWDRWFEIHNESYFTPEQHAEHLKWLATHTTPVYMGEYHPEVPSCVVYPVQEVLAEFGPYFTNSISWMIALAIKEGASTIGLWGVDMAQGTEYAEQRPSCEYLIGIAKGRGIEVIIPKESELLTTAWQYGVQNAPPFIQKMKVRKQELLDRANALAAEIAQKQKEELYLRGAVDDCDYVIKNWGRL